jgi:glycosyltransferase involved in cell wall biosynthesis
MRHALFVCFHYPPEASSSGVLRTLKFTRYLAEHGWRITLIAPAIEAYEVVDEASSRNIPDTVEVIRTPFLNTREHLGFKGRYLAITAVPDRFIGWFPWAVAAGRRVARADPFDLVYSTSPHATAHLIARSLARRFRKPWVCDFRDPWHEEVPEEGAPTGKLFRGLERWLEHRVVSESAHIVTTTRELRDTLERRHPSVPGSRFSVIPNGYDEADFAEIDIPPPARGSRMCFVHAGSINPSFRDPVPLFAALKLAADRGGLDLDRLRLRFIGGGVYAESMQLKEAAARYGVSDTLEVVARLPYAAALRELASADVLLLLQASEDTRGLIPAKLYEYLRLKKPILALTLPGESSALLTETGGGVAIHPAQTEKMAEALIELFRHWTQGTLPSLHAQHMSVQRYERRALAAELADVFARVAP